MSREAGGKVSVRSAPPPLSGTLYVVATPIGNLGDITVRALEVLRAAPVIAAEDTRETRKLLSHFDIPAPPRFLSYREQNRARAGDELLALLQAGADVALVTDAGMPCVSDPGVDLVARCHAEGILVTVVPGASAFLAAVAALGLPSDRLAFEGFLSRRASHRRQRLAELAGEPRTMVFYEAPTRVADTLRELGAALGGGRRAGVARELTKKFEELRRGTLEELAAWAAAGSMRGEFVLVVEGGRLPPPARTEAPDAARLVAELAAAGMSRRDAAREAARRLGLPRKEAYRLSAARDERTR